MTAIFNKPHSSPCWQCDRVSCMKKELRPLLSSTNYADFHAAIDRCLDQRTTTHRGEIDTLITQRFQTFENVPLLAV
jgi:hypothetical protein